MGEEKVGEERGDWGGNERGVGKGRIDWNREERI